MTECCYCGRKLGVFVPEGTQVCCALCVVQKDNPYKPRKTLLIPIEPIIQILSARLEMEIDRFEQIRKSPFDFEKEYALIGSQKSIDDLRIQLYWFKQVNGEVQEDIVYTIE